MIKDRINQEIEVGNLVLFPTSTTNLSEGIVNSITMDGYVNIKHLNKIQPRKPSNIINLTKLHQNQSSLFI